MPRHMRIPSTCHECPYMGAFYREDQPYHIWCEYDEARPFTLDGSTPPSHCPLRPPRGDES